MNDKSIAAIAEGLTDEQRRALEMISIMSLKDIGELHWLGLIEKRDFSHCPYIYLTPLGVKVYKALLEDSK